MASEQAVVLHSQERPVYINKGSALTQNLIFSAALAGAGTYGLLALRTPCAPAAIGWTRLRQTATACTNLPTA